MRLIDADLLEKEGWSLHRTYQKDKTTMIYEVKAISEINTAQPEIIRCKDCKHYEIAWLKKDGTDNKRYKPSICVKGQYGITRKPDWFCADAERRADE